MTHKVGPIPPGHVPLLWPHVSGYIKAALDREASGRYALDDVLHLLLTQQAALWIAWRGDTVDAAVVTQIVHYPQCKDCRIWLVGGHHMRGWVTQIRDMIEDFARYNGCAFVSGGFRRGWLRIGGSGWREAGVNIEKRI